MNRFIIADATKCIGCRTCEVACAVSHHENQDCAALSPDEFISRIRVIKDHSWTTAVACHQCEDAPCANVCPVDAISREHGHIFVEQTRCIGCKSCMLAARLVRWRSFLRAKRRGRLSAICAGIGRRDRPVLKPARQRRCSAWMSRKCSGIGYGSSLFETFSGVSQRRNSALCLCQMRRKRLIRPTNSSKFNILQKSCRPDKRSASGNF